VHVQLAPQLQLLLSQAKDTGVEYSWKRVRIAESKALLFIERA